MAQGVVDGACGQARLRETGERLQEGTQLCLLLVTGYSRKAFQAYNSMNQHPDILTSGSEAVKVAFIGKGIAAKLQKRWEEHLACVSRGPQGTASASSDGTLPGNGPEKGPLFLDLCAPVQSRPLKTMNRPLDGDSTLPSASQYRPRKARSKQYVPSYRSGAFAILLALHRNAPHDGETLTKAQLVQLGQGLCDASFTVPDRSKRTQGPSGAQYAYTAWNSMKSLLQKDLVHREGHPNHRYSLTDEGRDIARKLEVGLHGEIVPLNDSAVVELPASQSTHQPVDSPARSIPPVTESLNDLPFVRFSSRSFEVILLLDAREVLDRGDRSLFAVGLEKEGIRVETRSLELGDAVWIARDDSGVEIVLDCLVERKTMADLVASIKDGRFNEQGFRQRRCGLRNVVYLVENTHMQTARNFGWDAIQTSLVLVQIRDGFFLKRVGSGQDSIEYLARMTRSIERIYQVCFPRSFHVQIL